jgi:hypothetical protein
MLLRAHLYQWLLFSATRNQNPFMASLWSATDSRMASSSPSSYPFAVLVGETPKSQEHRMRLHPLNLLCPRCRRQKLSYARPRQKSDLYHCDPATGGCRMVVVHRRTKGRCGVRLGLSFCHLGEFEPCTVGE